MMGLPGSGKSTWVKSLLESSAANNIEVCSCDEYHTTLGVYSYNAAKAAEFHSMCLLRFINCCKAGRNVVCDNTNLSPHAMAPYIAIAKAYGYNVRVIFCRTEDAYARQIHAVPQVQHNFMRTALNKMLAEWPGIWPELEVVVS